MTRLAPAKQAQRHASPQLRSKRFRYFFNLSASFIFERFVRDTANSLLPASNSVFDCHQYPIDEATNTYKDFKEVLRSVVGAISEYLSHQLFAMSKTHTSILSISGESVEVCPA